MFVKKLVEKASKKSGVSGEGLKPVDVDPRLVFHHGIPSGSAMFSYDSVQNILALSTQDGRIKLFGKENTQALLHSIKEQVPSKFLQFMENQGLILNVTGKNNIEVWDIDRKLLSYVHVFKDEITSFTVMPNGSYMFVGDSAGSISILKLEKKPLGIVEMKYTIPCSASHGNTTEGTDSVSVTHVLLQPRAETKRLLIIFSDGLILLWGIQESKSIFTTGGSVMISLSQEPRKVTSACWGCPFGSKVIVGYSNGEILIWNILPNQSPRTELGSGTGNQTVPLSKLNLGYKLDKIPILFLRWVYADGKASRLYVMGASEFASLNQVQVVLLNEQTESRIIKLALQLPEACFDLEIISSVCEQSKNKQDSLLLLGKSGRIYAYDDSLIEKYLLQNQSRVPPSLPKESMVKIPFTDSSITVAKFITENSLTLNNTDEDYRLLVKSFPPLFNLGTKSKDSAQPSSSRFPGFSMVDNLYITGHSNGALNFWDASCPFFLPIFSLHQQSEDDLSLSGVAVTALYFDANSRLLVSGDQSGMVRIFRLRPESLAIQVQGSMKKKNNHIIQSVNHVKVSGSILAMNVNHSTTHLAVGSDQGIVVVIDIEGCNIIYQKHIASGLSSGIVSLQFQRCFLHGFEKNILTVSTKDSSIFALDDETGSTLSSSMVSPKKPSRALFMQILAGDQNSSSVYLSNGREIEGVSTSANQLSILICSEKAAYVYSFPHAIQGVKRVQYKKKFQSPCCWASTFYSPSSFGIVLLFSTGKIEIRSLPELSLVKEISMGGVANSDSNMNLLRDSVVCSSRKGDIVMVNGDQELFAVSVLIHKEIFRLLDSISHIYQGDLMLPQEKLVTEAIIPKEKKRGMFSSVIKAKHVPELEVGEEEDTEQRVEDLSLIFSAANFENRLSRDNFADKEEDVGLDIDDIDLDDPGEKHKEQISFGAINKQKLAGKFNAFKEKLKNMKLKSENNSTREGELDRQEDSKTDSIDQIKRKYGFSSSDEISVARMTESKLHDNSRKLQGINERATEMQGTAKSFSSMASEMLRIAQQGRRNAS